jgi:hypothetical protein
VEIDRAIAAGVRFGCVLADAGYGLSALMVWQACDLFSGAVTSRLPSRVAPYRGRSPRQVGTCRTVVCAGKGRCGVEPVRFPSIFRAAIDRTR